MDEPPSRWQFIELESPWIKLTRTLSACCWPLRQLFSTTTSSPMKGGTAINLFVQNMPRLFVDIDVVYRPWRQVKIEVNIVFRGTVLPVEYRPLSIRTSDLFGVEFEAPILARDELYAGKLVAALDRQHPRDLFDVWQLYESGGLTKGMAECFTIYLAGHNRPPHEVLFGSDKDISAEYERAFVGMTEVECSLDTLLAARSRLRHDLPQKLTDKHKQFLGGLVRAEPDWSLLECSHVRELPALRWKLTNLEAFRKRRPADFSAQADALLAGLGLA